MDINSILSKMFLRIKPTYPLLWVALFLIILSVNSCRQDDFDMSPSLRLEFSTDSLLFDTVFTTVGSSTRYFKIYNRNSARINISSIELAGGANSFFRVNVDGRSGQRVEDITIGPRDSLFVFVEVTVEPVSQDLPLIISDSIVFSVNQNVQDVKLIAWGQDAHFIVKDPDSGLDYFLLTESTVWSGPKPYVIYGFMVVAPNVTLTIEEGTNVHLHHQSAMIFDSRASFRVNGTLENPVTIQGDRLEAPYSDLPGQWGFIWLSATSRNHLINHAIIKNGTTGIIMDSIGSFHQPTLRIRNSVIKNMDQIGLSLNGGWVEATNLQVSNCGVHAISMNFGGNYDFRHVTVANYYNLPGIIRQTPSVVVNNYFLDTLDRINVRELEKVYFGNSIIYGSLQEELLFDVFPDISEANTLFDHSLVRTQFQNQHSHLFQGSIFNQQPGFISSENDYRLREDSPVIGLGDPNISALIPFDILGNSREERSDMGAYQFYEIDEDEGENGE